MAPREDHGKRKKPFPLLLIAAAAFLSGEAAGGGGGGSRPPSSSNRLCFVSLPSCAGRTPSSTLSRHPSAGAARERGTCPGQGESILFSPLLRGSFLDGVAPSRAARSRRAAGGRWHLVSCSSGGGGVISAVEPPPKEVVTGAAVVGASAIRYCDGSVTGGVDGEACVKGEEVPGSAERGGGRDEMEQQQEHQQRPRRARDALARGMAATGRFFASDKKIQRDGDGARRRRHDDKAPPTNGEVEEEGLRVPRHVAFVMDGNGRWAASRNMPRRTGHVEGARRAGEAVEACRELGVEFVTLYAFSTENWNRPASEVYFLMELMERTLQEQREGLRRNGIRLTAIGELHRLPPRLRSLIKAIQEESLVEIAAGAETGVSSAASNFGDSAVQDRGLTGAIPVAGAGVPGEVLGGEAVLSAGASGGAAADARGQNGNVRGEAATSSHGDGGLGGETGPRDGSSGASFSKPATMTLCLAISYGGRAELAAAAREIAAEAAAGVLDPEDIDEDALGRRLSTTRLGIPDPDLVVRTSGESRLSNLLLWQAAYSELHVVSKAWPEFRRRDLVDAFRDFGRRKRRFGKTPEQTRS